jgi:hypothetical protein
MFARTLRIAGNSMFARMPTDCRLLNVREDAYELQAVLQFAKTLRIAGKTLWIVGRMLRIAGIASNLMR